MNFFLNPSDPYAVDALTYALNNPPCIIACSTLRAMDMIHQYLLANRKSCLYVRGALEEEHREVAFLEFEAGAADYLVTTTQLLYLGGRRFSREGVCIASSGHLTEPMAIQLAARIGPQGLRDPKRTFLIRTTKGAFA